MSKLFYITNERGFKNKVYPLQPPDCCIQYTTLFSLRKASAHKKQTPAALMLSRLPLEQDTASWYGLSKPQLEFLRNASEGHGIIKMGNSMIPFSNPEPKNTAVYKLITTKPGEATAEE